MMKSLCSMIEKKKWKEILLVPTYTNRRWAHQAGIGFVACHFPEKDGGLIHQDNSEMSPQNSGRDFVALESFA